MTHAVLRVKDWKRFQHYKHRKPPWIKLYRDLLDDRTFQALSDAAAVLLVNLWLLASENEGCVPHDSGAIAWRLRRPIQAVRDAIQELVRTGFVETDGDDASEPLALGLHGATPEKSRERDREETEQSRSAAATRDATLSLLERELPPAYHVALDGHLRGAQNPAGVAASIRALGPGGIHEKYSWAIIGRALFELAADKDPSFNARRLEIFCRRLQEAPVPGAPRDDVGEQLSRITA